MTRRDGGEAAMRRTLLLAVGLVLFCASVGCSKDKRERKSRKDRDDDEQVERDEDDDDRPSRTSKEPGLLARMLGASSPLVGEFRRAADAVCACQDMKCAVEKMEPLVKLSKDNQGKKVAKSDAEQIEASSKRVAKCIHELTRKAQPPKKE